MRRPILCFAAAWTACLWFALPAWAQYNIDCGTAFGEPAASFGGAGAQPGLWNRLSASSGALQPLFNIYGHHVGVQIHLQTPVTNFANDNLTTHGDSHALMDDLFNLGGAGSQGVLRVLGLRPGVYRTIVYAWAPDNVLYMTAISVNGSPLVRVGGNAGTPFAFQETVTHCSFEIAVGPGEPLVIQNAVAFGFGSLNGVQIVPKCPGDVTGDGATGLEDVGLVLQQYTQAVTPGAGADLTGDGLVDLADLGLVMQDYGCE